MATGSVQQSLLQAKSFERKGDFQSARSLYQAVLVKFPGNQLAIEGLTRLEKMGNPVSAPINPPRQYIDDLISLFQQGKFIAGINQSREILNRFPRSAVVWNLLGVLAQSAGNLELAFHAFTKAIDLNPQFAESYNNLSVTLQALGRYDAAFTASTEALRLNPDYVEAHYNMGNILREKGDAKAAIAAYKIALSKNPDHLRSKNNLGNVLRDQGHLTDAMEVFKQVVAQDPSHSDAFNNLGAVLRELGDLDEAIAAYECALASNPDHAGALNNLGGVLQMQGKIEDALAKYRRALEIEANDIEIYCNMGRALLLKENFAEALDIFTRALTVDANSVDAYLGLGNSYIGLGQEKESAAAYGRAVKIDPDSVDAHFAFGMMYKKQGKIYAALGAFKRALKTDPENSIVNNALGGALLEIGQSEEAEAAFELALKNSPNSSEILGNLGGTLIEQKRIEEGILTLTRALEIDPKNANLEATIHNQKLFICDWNNYFESQEACQRLGITTTAVSPFGMLALEDNAERQFIRARNWANLKFNAKPIPLEFKNSGKGDRLRVGYFGQDFNNHPVMLLISGLLREHDKEKFEIFVFSYGRDKSGDLRKQAELDVEHFIDVSEEPNMAIFDLVREYGIDVAIDLNAYTGNSRSHLFQYRLAPVQINYLGYPGTMGCDFMDYIIADPTLIPPEFRSSIQEKVIYLPHSYLPSDNQRLTGESSCTRADYGLPDDAFVLCSFNNIYKITPREFDVWMRILNKLDKSVLWLRKPSKLAEENLRKEAKLRGIDPDRLVFAEKVPSAEHIARHRLADLFVDSFNYNAHTTAADALWAGLPLVTLIGSQFSARVGASCLNAVGLPDLVTTSESDYEALILSLAGDKERLDRLKAKLSADRAHHPLFDTVRYTRNMERAFLTAFEIYKSGRPAEDIWVTETGM